MTYYLVDGIEYTDFEEYDENDPRFLFLEEKIFRAQVLEEELHESWHDIDRLENYREH